jgi:ATP-dependent Clp protease ATP-binding subunit ClpA
MEQRGLIGDEPNGEIAGKLLLMAIVSGDLKVGLAALQRLGIDLSSFKMELESSIQLDAANYKPRTSPLDVSQVHASFQPLLSTAARYADRLQHTWVGTEHLLLAAVDVTAPPVSTILERHNMNVQAIQATVLELLSWGR